MDKKKFKKIIATTYRRSPSCPNDVLMVGSARAAVKDLAVSEGTPLIVMSSMICGGVPAGMESLYTEHTRDINKYML